MKYVGIIVAMEEEREAVANIMTEQEIRQIYNLRLIVGKIQNTKCVLAKCGVGKVNAGRVAQILNDYFEISYIVNIGAGASINELINIGDIIIGKNVVQHDFDITAFGHSKGYISGTGDKIECNRELVDEFEQMIKSFPEKNYQIKIGTIASGDIFCTDVWMKDKIHAKFNADVVDMEGAAVGQVCYLNETPFIAIRCISDSPTGKNTTTFEENLKLASRRCANILKEFLA